MIDFHLFIQSVQLYFLLLYLHPFPIGAFASIVGEDGSFERAKLS